jgi:polysaccharide export outer membrane protein
MKMQLSSHTVTFFATLFALVCFSNLQAADVYRLEPGDVMEINVWEEPELMKEALVAPDGSLSFPLVGEIQAAGRSVEEIRQLITEKLREEYIADAAVNVSLLRTSGSRIYVIGRVNRPGVFPLDTSLDVLQALTLAGGAAEFADVEKIKVIRRSEDGSLAIPFNYQDVERGRGLEQNIVLESGDTVIVP